MRTAIFIAAIIVAAPALAQEPNGQAGNLAARQQLTACDQLLGESYRNLAMTTAGATNQLQALSRELEQAKAEIAKLKAPAAPSAVETDTDEKREKAPH